jgi:hypothetical protein
VLLDFGFCSLSKEMSIVDHYLPYYRQWLITHPLSVLLPFKPLFTESLHGGQLLAPPLFSAALSVNLSLFSVLIVYCSVFFVEWGSIYPGGFAGFS